VIDVYGNPVEGQIRPPGSPLIVGSFRVTSTFGEHVASGRGEGVDIGNGRCGDPVLAMADGKVTMARLLGSANVVRIAHPQFAGDESGYAHLATIEVQLGKSVKRGDRIGTVGKTGATACHLHLGLKRNGVEIDSWPLLDQNQPAKAPANEAREDPVNQHLKGMTFTPNRKVRLIAGGTGRWSPSFDPNDADGNRAFTLRKVSNSPILGWVTGTRVVLKNGTVFDGRTEWAVLINKDFGITFWHIHDVIDGEKPGHGMVPIESHD